MNQDQQVVSWLAVAVLVIGIWLTYRAQLSSIIFGTPQPAQQNPSQPLGSLGTGLYPTPNGGFQAVPPGYGINNQGQLVPLSQLPTTQLPTLQPTG